MPECKLCSDRGKIRAQALDYSSPAHFLDCCRCPDCLERKKNGEIEEWKTKYEFAKSALSAAVEESAKLRDGISRSIADGCGEFSSPCDACIVLQKLLDETEIGEHSPKTNPL